MTVGEHYGFSREWILIMITIMNCISAERLIPFDELVDDPDIRDEIIQLSKRISSRPNRNYSNKPEDVIILLRQLKKPTTCLM